MTLRDMSLCGTGRRKLSRVDNEPVDATKARVDSIEVSEVLL